MFVYLSSSPTAVSSVAVDYGDAAEVRDSLNEYDEWVPSVNLQDMPRKLHVNKIFVFTCPVSM